MKSKVWKIEVSNLVNLFIANEGFLFAHFSWYPKKNPDPDELRSWEQWLYEWPLYIRDNIQTKIFRFLDQIPSRLRGERFFQEIHF